MREVVDYLIIQTDSRSTLEEAVVIYLQRGFQPYGPLTTLLDGQIFQYIQAMVKYGTDRYGGKIPE